MVEEHFVEVGLRLTPRLRREMRLSKFIFHIFFTNNAGCCRLGTYSLDLHIHYHLNTSLVFDEGSWRSN